MIAHAVSSDQSAFHFGANVIPLACSGRMALDGDSAGANLAAILAADADAGACAHAAGDSAMIRAVVLFYPVTDLTLPAYADFFEPYVGTTLDQNPAGWSAASPLSRISGDEAPFLLIHGAWDVRVPMSESERFKAALQAAGIQVELLRMPRADHNFLADYPDGDATMQSLEAMLSFFDKTL